MDTFLIKVFGYIPLVLFGDLAVFDRWRWLKRNLKGGGLRTLDAGCGSGAFTLWAGKRGNAALGISFDDRNNAAGTRRAKALGLSNVRFITGDLRELDKFGKQLGEFDQAICFETIEHIKGDAKLLRDLSALLAPGGRLLLTTPYKFYRRLPGDGISDIEDGGHVRWGYTHEEMRALMEEAGLTIVKEDYITGRFVQYVMRLERHLSRINSRLSWALTFPLRPLALLDQIFGFRSYPALSIGVIAEKR